MSSSRSSQSIQMTWPGPTVGHRVVILGAGGTAVDFYEAARASGNEVLGLLDDNISATGQSHYPVIGPLDSWKDLPSDVLFFLGIGSVTSHRHRLQIVERLGIPAERYAIIIHPQASISPSAVIGYGSGVLAHSTIGARVYIGSHVEILQLCLIGHDACIEDGAVISGSASLSGGVCVGCCAFIGAAATIRNGLRVGAEALLGMNSTLLEDVPVGAVYGGTPARPIRSNGGVL